MPAPAYAYGCPHLRHRWCPFCEWRTLGKPWCLLSLCASTTTGEGAGASRVEPCCCAVWAARPQGGAWGCWHWSGLGWAAGHVVSHGSTHHTHHTHHTTARTTRDSPALLAAPAKLAGACPCEAWLSCHSPGEPYGSYHMTSLPFPPPCCPAALQGPRIPERGGPPVPQHRAAGE
jgi:hypothetical protein